MSLSDIEYGWTQQAFDYVNVSIHQSIQLESITDEGEWERRDALSVDEAKFESRSQFRYSEVLGSIIGQAQFSDYMDQMILGVPEDKTQGFTATKNRLGSIEVRINAVMGETLNESVRYGNVRFLEQTEFYDNHVLVTVFITKERFADICRIAVEPEVTFQIGLNLKCWHWTGPIGDSKVFFNTEGYDPAELAYLRVSRKLPSRVEPDQEIDE